MADNRITQFSIVTTAQTFVLQHFNWKSHNCIVANKIATSFVCKALWLKDNSCDFMHKICNMHVTKHAFMKIIKYQKTFMHHYRMFLINSYQQIQSQIAKTICQMLTVKELRQMAK